MIQSHLEAIAAEPTPGPTPDALELYSHGALDARAACRQLGLSGGPMLDTAQLALGRVRMVGLVTEQDKGTARGEPSILLKDMIAQI